jgi:WD40 repeat protein
MSAIMFDRTFPHLGSSSGRLMPRQGKHRYLSTANKGDSPPQQRHATTAKPSYSDRLIGSYSVTKTLSGHSGCVNSIEFSDDGSLLMTGSDDRSVCIYGAEDGTDGFGCRMRLQLRHDANIFNAVFLPSFPNKILSCALDGKTVLTELVTNDGSSEGRVLFSNASTLASKIACHPAWVQTAFVGYGDGDVVWLDLRENKPVDVFNPHQACVEEVNALAVHPSHPFLIAVGTNTHLVYLMDVRMTPPRNAPERSRGRLASAFIRVPDVREGMCEGIGGLSFSSRGSHLCVNFKSNDVYTVPWQRTAQAEAQEDRGTSNEIGITRFRGRRNERTMFKEAIFFHDDAYVVTGGDCGNLYFWQSSSGKLVHHTKGDGDIVNGVLAHDARPYLICSGIDNTAKVLNASADIAHHAAPPSPMLFGTRHLGGRRHVDNEPPPVAFFSSEEDLSAAAPGNADDSSDDSSTAASSDFEDRNDDSVVAQCDTQNINIWTNRESLSSSDIMRQKEQLRVLCMAFSRHMHYFYDASSDVPLLVLKRLVAISQAVRQIHDGGDSAGSFVVSSGDEDDEEDDEEWSEESDNGSEPLDVASDNTAEALGVADFADDGEGVLQLPPSVHEDEESSTAEVQLRLSVEPPSSGDDGEQPNASSDDDSAESEVDSPSLRSSQRLNEEAGQATLIPVVLVIVERLLASLDSLMRQAVDDNGTPMYSLHWWSSIWGGASRCEVLPLSARKARMVLLLVESLASDKLSLVQLLGSQRDVVLYKKMMCRTLLRRIYFEMSHQRTQLALTLCDRCADDSMFEGINGLGPWAPKRSRATTKRQSIRVVPLALKLRILQAHCGDQRSIGVGTRAEIASLLRRVVRRCKGDGAIVRRTIEVLQSEVESTQHDNEE